MCLKLTKKWYRIIWSWGENGATFTDYYKAKAPDEAIRKLCRDNTAVPRIVIRGVSEPLTPPCWEDK